MVKKWIKSQKLKDKSLEELTGMVKSLKDEKFTLRFQKSTGKLDNFQLMKQARKRLAAVNTLIRQKETEASQEGTK